MKRTERLAFDETTYPPEVIAEWQEHLQREAARVRELRVQALIQPKPWWMPKGVWYWLVSQVLVIVEQED